jgi:hypothetical protein
MNNNKIKGIIEHHNRIGLHPNIGACQSDIDRSKEKKLGNE